MEKIDILERVLSLINPHLENEINKLETNETDYFIHHLTQNLERSLKHWEFKTDNNERLN